MESASLLSRESTTLSFSKPQKGHFMSEGRSLRLHCNRGRTPDLGPRTSDIRPWTSLRSGARGPTSALRRAPYFTRQEARPLPLLFDDFLPTACATTAAP